MAALKLRRLIFRRPITLRSHLTVLVLATMLPLLIFSGLTIYILTKQERDTFQRGAKERTRALATAVDVALKGSITALDALASNDDLRSGNLRRFYDAAMGVLKAQPDWSTINLADRSGQQIINLLRPFGAELPKVQAPAEITQVLESGRPVIGNMLLGPITKQYDFAVRVPVFNNGVLTYVLSAVIKPQSIGALLPPQSIPSDWIAVVLDGDNRFVTRSIGGEKVVGQLASESLRAALAHSPEGWFRGTTVEGWPVYTPYNRSPFSGWTVAMGIPASVVDAPLRGPVLYVTFFGAALLLLGVALAWWLSSRTAGSIESLVGLVTNLGLGKDTAAAAAAAANDIPSRVAEIDHLRETFLTARRIIQERSEDQHRLEEALRHDVAQRMRAEQFLLLQIATSRALIESEDLKSAAPKIVQAICELTGWEVGAIWEVDRAADELKSVDVWHGRETNVPEFEAASRQIRFAPGVGLAGRVWASGEPAWIRDVTQDSTFLRTPQAIKEGLHAGVCFSITIGTEVLGVIECFSHEIREPDRDTLQTLANIGAQLGQFIERKRAQEAMGESQARLSGIINSAMDAVIAVDHRQRVVLFNPAAEQMFGCTAADALLNSLDRFIPTRFREAHSAHIENFSRTGVTSRRMGALGALSALRANGEEFPIEASISQLEFGAEKLFTVILRDISEHERAHQQLRNQARLLDLSAEAILVLDAQRRITYWNNGAEELYGYTREEALGKVAHELMQTEFPEPLERINEKLLRDGRWFGEMLHMRKDGLNIVVASRWSLDRDAQGQPASILETNRDITARKRAEQSLEQAARQKDALYQFVERRHRAKSFDEIYDAALDAILSALACERASILLSDGSGVMRFVASRGLSENYCKAIEGHSPWKPEESNPPPVCIPDIAAAQLDASLKAVITAEGIRALAFIPLVMNGKLGGTFMTYYDTPHVFNDEELELSMTLARQLALGIERKQAEDEIAQLNKDLERRVGERTSELQQVNATLLRDMEERKKLAEQLLQAQKMESIGTLAGGVAHDFNNILNIIQAYASVLTDDGARSEEIGENVTVINDTVKRGAALVQQLLTVARKTEGVKLESVELNPLVERLVRLIKETFPKTIELSLALESNLPPITADKNQIEQALLNLALNARDAMPGGGRLVFKTRSVDGATLHPLGKPEQRYACIEVKDTGVGIEESIRERIFEPFFTTKDKTQGTGLGLSVVYGIVKNHNGFVDVESKPMAGTSFRLYFPIAAVEVIAKEPAVETAAETPAMSNGAETVLLAEDEANMLHLLEKIFLRRGYKVLKATDGQTALDIYRQHKEEIAVVMLDMGLPRISGRDVLAKIRSENPEVMVIVTSGYIEPAIKSEIDHARVKFLHKPYAPADVFKTLQSLIATAS